ncbi:Hsp70 family protein [Massilia sp. B-10]|nr:Hsp70 family protein [Massilia sp. B-10]
MIVGIDLGTTNSLIAVWENGAARLIPNALGDVLTPSCVSIDEDGSILVGRAARPPANPSRPQRRRLQAPHGQRQGASAGQARSGPKNCRPWSCARSRKTPRPRSASR